MRSQAGASAFEKRPGESKEQTAVVGLFRASLALWTRFFQERLLTLTARCVAGPGSAMLYEHPGGERRVWNTLVAHAW
ncbi:MAG TPA: hypothetical protein VGF67_30125 [Ktedonobacteraceae bacterium]